MWIALGNTSLLDWDALTSSLGWIGSPSSSLASEAITSLAFMLLEVPEPVWKTSMREVLVVLARRDRAGRLLDRRGLLGARAPRAGRSSRAAAPLISPSAATSAGSIGRPEIGKFSTARWVCAR